MTVTAAPPQAQAPESVRRRRRNGRSNLVGWGFVGPALIAFVVFLAFPVLWTFYLSLTASDGFGGSRFVGLRNYLVMPTDPTFRKALAVTVGYTAVSAVLQTAIPLAIALLIYLGPRRSAMVYRTLIFLPAAISLTITALIWRIGLTPDYGIFNRLLEVVGLGSLAHGWLGDPKTVVPTIIVVSLWQSTGLGMMIFYAGLTGLDSAVLESARIDGANRWREVWSIIIPLQRPVIEVVAMLNVINSLKLFDLNFVMTAGGPDHASESLSTYVYRLTFGTSTGGAPAFGYGSAISVFVFVFAAAATLLLSRARRSNL